MGPTYGRRTITGLLASEGYHISEDRVGVALKTIQPQYHSLRCQATARSLNPVPYKADYFGEKIHIDQNEKLILFGITHTAAIAVKL